MLLHFPVNIVIARRYVANELLKEKLNDKLTAKPRSRQKKFVFVAFDTSRDLSIEHAYLGSNLRALV